MLTINRNYNSYNNSLNFGGLGLFGKKLTSDEKTNIAIKNGLNFIKNNERMIPENGKFRRLAVRFDIEGTKNAGGITVDFSPTEPKNKRVIVLSAERKGTDVEVSDYFAEGTKNEVLEILNKKDFQKRAFDEIKELSKSVDEQFK